MVIKREPHPRPGNPPARATLAAAPRPTEVHTVAISALRPADSPRRGGLSEDHVRLLAENDATLPPILVHRLTMRVIDGMHRLRAAALRGQHTIDAEFFDGTDDDAFIRAVQENITHGLPLPLPDRRAAAARIMTSYPHLSDRSIAARTGLAAKTIAGLRRSIAALPRLNARVGADGRLRPLDGTDGRRRAAAAIAARPGATVRDIAKAAGVSVGTAHDVRARIRRGEGPDPERPRAPAGRGGSRRADVGLVPADPARITASRIGLRDGHLILQNLMKDPSLRHSEPGRELLRWLRAHVIATRDWAALIDAVPAHCTDVVADLARQCADAWAQFATEVKHRRHSAV